MEKLKRINSPEKSLEPLWEKTTIEDANNLTEGTIWWRPDLPDTSPAKDLALVRVW